MAFPRTSSASRKCKWPFHLRHFSVIFPVDIVSSRLLPILWIQWCNCFKKWVLEPFWSYIFVAKKCFRSSFWHGRVVNRTLHWHYACRHSSLGSHFVFRSSCDKDSANIEIHGCCLHQCEDLLQTSEDDPPTWSTQKSKIWHVVGGWNGW